MNTLLFFCLCDSVMTKLCGECKSVIKIQEACTNSADVSIANTICNSIVQVVLICVAGFILWKLIDHIANGIAGLNKRRWEIKDNQNKQKAELQTKLIDFKKELAFPYNKGKDGKFEKKDYDTNASTAYVTLLETLLHLPEKNNNEDKNPQRPSTAI